MGALLLANVPIIFFKNSRYLFICLFMYVCIVTGMIVVKPEMNAKPTLLKLDVDIAFYPDVLFIYLYMTSFCLSSA